MKAAASKTKPADKDTKHAKAPPHKPAKPAPKSKRGSY
jgi:hypothetical protein